MTKYARDVDPWGSRTLGEITKPDTLYGGSESEKKYWLRLPYTEPWQRVFEILEPH